MKRVLCTVLALSAIVVLVVAVSASGKSPSHAKHRGHGDHHGKSITVIEHATTDTTADTGATGDSVGDILTFANEVFDATNATKAGTDQGYCVRVVAGTSYECTWTTFLPGGQIVVAGPFYDAKDSTLAITGGTGRYRDARGTMDLHARAGGTEYAFVFHVDD
jgi:allene oxide cyclase